ncbi:hypothetical protein F511_45757 [Dorcoceras hygrometricum]|uniref:Secreted protein n=1 Tax=Dorcoceras hygrometricum TaxID=472368 RepID=A0A2Z7A2U5_9LAMI|nr:hypothetical protein F511_45757 [Dorcoceras hygrometricum]
MPRATVARYCATCCRAWHGLAALVAGLRAAVCRTLHAGGGRRPACFPASLRRLIFPSRFCSGLSRQPMKFTDRYSISDRFWSILKF